jgi:DNA-directed RNA polymerase subunit M/transcription elongation factor TFIIS
MSTKSATVKVAAKPKKSRAPKKPKEPIFEAAPKRIISIQQRLDNIIASRGYDRDEVYSIIDLVSDDRKNDTEFIYNVISLYNRVVINIEDRVRKDTEKTPEEIREKGLKEVKRFAATGNIWDNILNEDSKLKLSRHIDTMRSNEMGTRGIEICGRCHKDRIAFSNSKQIRRGDEGEAVSKKCLDCGNIWV